MRASVGSLARLAIATTIGIFATPSPSFAAPFAGAPHTLPGVIEAENFDTGGEGEAYHEVDSWNNTNMYRASEVDIFDAPNASNHAIVGIVHGGEWIQYSVLALKDGIYSVLVAVASDGPGGSFYLQPIGGDRSESITIPDTGGWFNFRTVRLSLRLSAGPQTMRIVMENDSPATGAVGNFDYLRFQAVNLDGSAAYPGPAAYLPGFVEMENYNDFGTAFNDTTPGNVGGAYRPDDVDIWEDARASNQYLVGATHPGEFLGYDVFFGAAGTYTVEVRVASDGPGGTFHIELNGVDVTGPVTIPDTGGWFTWRDISLPRISIAPSANMNKLMVVRMDTDSAATGAVGNFDFIHFRLIDQPGNSRTIEAENFDRGAFGSHDINSGNIGSGNNGGPCSGTDVDMWVDPDNANNCIVGAIHAGEWLTYTQYVSADSEYMLEVRVASAGPGGTFHIEFDGEDLTGPINVPDTGGWFSWTIVKVERAIRPVFPTQVMRIVMDNDSAVTGAVGNIDWVRLTNIEP